MILDDLKKKLIFRAGHRGTREMDILVGRFAEQYVPGMSADECAQFERLLTCNDPDVYDWYTGKTPVPVDENTAVVQMFLGFRLVS